MQAETIYQTLLWIGAIGVGVMGVMGAAAHGSHGGHSHGHHGGDTGHGFADSHGGSGGLHHGHAGHDGGAHAPVHHGGHGHANGYNDHGAHHHGGHSHAHHSHDPTANRAEGGATAIAAILGVISPLTLFSVSLGAGATGLLLGTRFSTVVTAVLSALAGLALLLMVVRPLMRWVQRWASKPAETLAGAVAAEAIAQNRFDAQGRGIVNVPIDGQIVRLLAYLERDDHAGGITVAPGDRLVVTQIDEAKNTCRVSKF